VSVAAAGALVLMLGLALGAICHPPLVEKLPSPLAAAVSPFARLGSGEVVRYDPPEAAKVHDAAPDDAVATPWPTPKEAQLRTVNDDDDAFDTRCGRRVTL